MSEPLVDFPLPSPDHERRFGGLRRLYGVEGAQRLFRAHVMIAGLGGVGSWCVEALARSGVRRLTLIDLDHVAESNINRQIQATDENLGKSKADALKERIASYHPDCEVVCLDAFVEPDNWSSLLSEAGDKPDAVIDACDQVRAKATMAAWAATSRVPFVSVGAAGGKRLAHKVEMLDLGEVTHDPLLASLRYQLRRHHGLARHGRMGVTCVFSREAVAPPDASCAVDGGSADVSLNCHGYGSSVAVTAGFGMCAAGWLMDQIATGTKKIPASFQNGKKDAII
ncbi:tRNA threonylcarbamoyladenosine dehydratase [Hydrogenophaga sp. 5NK40-0174]|uniref:tRNA threonylcarbamoyladenosine dehydratase n=1 Tax=Hydrogenophaga sp. 5NK40-0174 TaxID=3127649 RepID=UPI00310A1E29